MIVQPWSAFAPNPHLAWYNQKRAWLIYVVLIYVIRLCVGAVLRDNLAWTLTNVLHALVTFYLFHWCKGLLFPHYSVKNDKLTVWEQIDGEEHYTPTKKVFLLIPVCIFLIAVQSDTTFSISLFSLNLAALVLCIVPALPALHRARPFGFNTD